jgi:hypothetical protein
MQTTITYSTARDVIESAQAAFWVIGTASIAMWAILQAVMLVLGDGMSGKTDWTSVAGCLFVFFFMMAALVKRVAA